MANDLTAGAWFSAPTKKTSLFTLLLSAEIDARQRHADRLVEQYLAVHGTKFADDAERQIERLLFKEGLIIIHLIRLARSRNSTPSSHPPGSDNTH